jgi:hypothetical protein
MAAYTAASAADLSDETENSMFKFTTPQPLMNKSGGQGVMKIGNNKVLTAPPVPTSRGRQMPRPSSVRATPTYDYHKTVPATSPGPMTGRQMRAKSKTGEWVG